jgi:hypothetical protein
MGAIRPTDQAQSHQLTPAESIISPRALRRAPGHQRAIEPERNPGKGSRWPSRAIDEGQRTRKSSFMADAVDVAALYLVTTKTQPVVPAEVDRLEAELVVSLPRGYRDLMVRVGPGAFVNELYVLDPDAVRRVTAEQQKYDTFSPANGSFWSNYSAVMGDTNPAVLVSIARSKNGDELVFQRDASERLLLFPRHSDAICEAGTDLRTALAWFARSGVCVPRSDFFYNTEIDQTPSEWRLRRADGNDDVLEELVQTFSEKLQSDRNGGEDLAYWFFFRRLQGMAALWEEDVIESGDHEIVFSDSGTEVIPRTGRGRCRLTLWHDPTCTAAWNDLGEQLLEFGWTISPV